MLSLLVLIVCIYPANVFSQNYNVNTVQILKGQVVRVDRISSGKNSSGIHLLIKTDKDTIPVHVGPEWYLSKQNVQFNVDDKIEVKGSKIIYNNSPAIVAGEIKKGTSTLVLRDANGYPLWSGGRNR